VRLDNWILATHIMRYLCGMVDYGLRYVSDGDIQLQGHTNVNWEGSVED